MKTRDFNKRIEFWITATISDSFGGEIATEALSETTWAKVAPVLGAGRRYQEIGLSELAQSAIFTVRRRNDLNINAQNVFIKYLGDRYKIQNAGDQDILKSYIEILATKEQTAQVVPVAGGGATGFPYTFS